MFELNKIYLGDCLEGLRQFPDKCVDLVLTDPPYEIDTGSSKRTERIGAGLSGMLSELTKLDITSGFDVAVLDELMRVCKVPNLYFWCNHKQIPMYIDYFVNKHGCVFDIIIWHKPNVAPLNGGRYLSDKEYCLYFRKGGYCRPKYDRAQTVYSLPMNVRDKKLYNHPTIKPESILRNLILNSSRPGDVVLDPFMGSGTTAVVAQSLGRKYVGFELSAAMHESARLRVEGSRLEAELFGATE